MEAHQIVHQVQEVFRGLAKKLSRITDKSDEWFASHGREPKTQNPTQSGNVSPVTHYLKYVRQYEAAQPGAGKMLNNRVHAELEMEFSSERMIDISQKALHAGLLKESFEVFTCFTERNFSEASLLELSDIEKECAELRDKANDAIATIRAIAKVREAR